jgi:hypothetical protein
MCLRPVYPGTTPCDVSPVETVKRAASPRALRAAGAERRTWEAGKFAAQRPRGGRLVRPGKFFRRRGWKRRRRALAVQRDTQGMGLGENRRRETMADCTRKLKPASIGGVGEFTDPRPTGRAISGSNKASARAGIITRLLPGTVIIAKERRHGPGSRSASGKRRRGLRRCCLPCTEQRQHTWSGQARGPRQSRICRWVRRVSICADTVAISGGAADLSTWGCCINRDVL